MLSKNEAKIILDAREELAWKSTHRANKLAYDMLTTLDKLRKQPEVLADLPFTRAIFY